MDAGYVLSTICSSWKEGGLWNYYRSPHSSKEVIVKCWTSPGSVTGSSLEMHSLSPTPGLSRTRWGVACFSEIVQMIWTNALRGNTHTNTFPKPLLMWALCLKNVILKFSFKIISIAVATWISVLGHSLFIHFFFLCSKCCYSPFVTWFNDRDSDIYHVVRMEGRN